MSTTTVDRMPIENAMARARAEFLEMPGLKLTMEQAARLWSLDRETCRAVLLALVKLGFLTTTRDASFIRS